MNREIIIKIGGTTGAGKSTVAIIIEQALMDAGINYRYEEGDSEMEERTTSFIDRTLENLEQGKVRDYGITVNLKTVPLYRRCYDEGVTEEDIRKF